MTWTTTTSRGTPKELTEARLTRDEVEALGSYRAARNQADPSRIVNLVVVLPISRDFLDSEGIDEDALQHAAAGGAHSAVSRVVANRP